jgi:ribonuclease VapC
MKASELQMFCCLLKFFEKANYPIAYADCFAAAVAKKFQGLLVTGDPEFKLLQNYIDIMWI